MLTTTYINLLLKLIVKVVHSVLVWPLSKSSFCRAKEMETAQEEKGE
jgi:hypothetical protein